MTFGTRTRIPSRPGGGEASKETGLRESFFSFVRFLLVCAINGLTVEQYVLCEDGETTMYKLAFEGGQARLEKLEWDSQDRKAIADFLEKNEKNTIIFTSRKDAEKFAGWVTRFATSCVREFFVWAAKKEDEDESSTEFAFTARLWDHVLAGRPHQVVLDSIQEVGRLLRDREPIFRDVLKEWGKAAGIEEPVGIEKVYDWVIGDEELKLLDIKYIRDPSAEENDGIEDADADASSEIARPDEFNSAVEFDSQYIGSIEVSITPTDVKAEFGDVVYRGRTFSLVTYENDMIINGVSASTFQSRPHHFESNFSFTWNMFGELWLKFLDLALFYYQVRNGIPIEQRVVLYRLNDKTFKDGFLALQVNPRWRRVIHEVAAGRLACVDVGAKATHGAKSDRSGGVFCYTVFEHHWAGVIAHPRRAIELLIVVPAEGRKPPSIFVATGPRDYDLVRSLATFYKSLGGEARVEEIPLETALVRQNQKSDTAFAKAVADHARAAEPSSNARGPARSPLEPYAFFNDLPRAAKYVQEHTTARLRRTDHHVKKTLGELFTATVPDSSEAINLLGCAHVMQYLMMAGACVMISNGAYKPVFEVFFERDPTQIFRVGVAVITNPDKEFKYLVDSGRSKGQRRPPGRVPAASIDWLELYVVRDGAVLHRFTGSGRAFAAARVGLDADQSIFFADPKNVRCHVLMQSNLRSLESFRDVVDLASPNVVDKLNRTLAARP